MSRSGAASDPWRGVPRRGDVDCRSRSLWSSRLRVAVVALGPCHTRPCHNDDPLRSAEHSMSTVSDRPPQRSRGPTCGDSGRVRPCGHSERSCRAAAIDGRESADQTLRHCSRHPQGRTAGGTSNCRSTSSPARRSASGSPEARPDAATRSPCRACRAGSRPEPRPGADAGRRAEHRAPVVAAHRRRGPRSRGGRRRPRHRPHARLVHRDPHLAGGGDRARRAR